MLRISKLTDYAIIILIRLALNAQRIVSAAGIAEEVHLALPTVSKILKILAEAKLVISFRGPGGGYQLAKNATETTIAEVVLVMEGKLAMTECCAPINDCDLDSLCAVKENWQVINKMIFSVLAGFTLHDMIRPLEKSSMKLRGIPVTVQGIGHD
ncbi:MAG: putative HTH-type transcriptional regulator [Gammaproteobacteria bacterium]|jgi:FeS assembly SUF system regulator|nr:putative HTH-type transcriptional regulator [Gammaproteobacteria bacterium]